MADSNSTPPGEPMDDGINKFIKGIKQRIGHLKNLITQGEWLEAGLYLAALFVAAFAPVFGVVYTLLIQEIVEADNILTPPLYNTIFFIILCSICFICLLSKILSEIGNSKVRKRAFIAASVLLSIIIISKFSFTGFGYVKGASEDKISWGEESLFDTQSPEAIIFKNNYKAVNSATNPYRRPFKIGVSMPISWENGFYNAREIALGVAIAQDEWNKNPKNINQQFVIVLADDGFDNPEDEKQVAKDMAEDLIKTSGNLLGVIGHFSSDATYAAQGVYHNNQTVLISPTSTVKRCANSSDEFELDELKDTEDILAVESDDNCLQFSDYVFRTAISDDKAIESLISYINSNEPDIKKIVVISERQSIYSTLYKRAFIKKLEASQNTSIEIVNKATINNCGIEKIEDFNEGSCFKLINKINPDALLLIPSTKNNIWVEKVLEFKHELDNSGDDKKLALLGADSMYQAGFVNLNGKSRPETEGMLIPLSWHRSLNPNEKCERTDKILECRGVEVFSNKSKEPEEEFNSLGINWRTAMSYDAAQILFKAIANTSKQKCSSLEKMAGRRSNCIRRNLKDVLSETTIENRESTSKHTIAFRNNDRRRDAGYVIVEAKSATFQQTRPL